VEETFSKRHGDFNTGTVPRRKTRVSDPDPDPGGQKLPTEVEKKEISCFEVLDVLF
jgi:hypothetical protein